MVRTDIKSISIVALSLFRGLGGGETHTVSLINAMFESPTNDVQAFLPHYPDRFLNEKDVIRFDFVRYGKGLLGRLLASCAAYLCIPAIFIHARRSKVIFYPLTNQLPRLPVLKGQRLVVTVHDMQHHDVPENFGFFQKIYRYAIYDRTLRKADHIISVSEFTKRSLLRNLKLDESKVTVIYPGINSGCVLHSQSQRETFAVYPAMSLPHKNHQVLFDAIGIIRQFEPNFQILLTGGGIENFSSLPKGIRHLGYVDRNSLEDLYSRASCLIFPSLYEGFGHPALEAMTFGCPVAASAGGAIEEVAGIHAEYFDPNSPESVASATLRAITMDTKSREIAREYALSFTWEQSAKKLRELFLQIC